MFDKGDMYCVSPRKCVDFKFNNIDLKLVEGLNLNWFTKDTDAHSKRILTAE